MTLSIVEDANLSRIFLVGKMAFGCWLSRTIILADNLTGHCFVLKDLVPMSFFKLVMIV